MEENPLSRPSPGNSLTPEELERYRRQIILPELGRQGQGKIREASVLVAGAGGLGSAAAMALASAGVGRLGIVDHDRVEVSNIHRQFLYTTRDIGRLKVEAADERLRQVNPHVVLEMYPVRLTASTVLPVLERYDLLVGCTDSLSSTYLLNDACILLGKPYVHGSVYRFEGEVGVFDARHGPCYRCLHPVPPLPGRGETDPGPWRRGEGIIGPLPSVVGSLQALETLKLLTGAGEILLGRIMFLDSMKAEVRTLAIAKDPVCPACGTGPSLGVLEDREGDRHSQESMIPTQDKFHITPEELQAMRERGENPFLLDVREPFEYNLSTIGGHLVPLRELEARLGELDPQRPTVVYCHHGIRSIHAVNLLRLHGWQKVWNLAGGIHAWAVRVDPLVPVY